MAKENLMHIVPHQFLKRDEKQRGFGVTGDLIVFVIWLLSNLQLLSFLRGTADRRSSRRALVLLFGKFAFTLSSLRVR